jgi:RHS repeat-associated protein
MTKLLMLLCLLVAEHGAYAQSTGTVTYVYTDPQGTPLAEADASGNITATFDYTPYGTTALGSSPNGPGYTGHVNDPETNLVYMQARYYDPATGHFLSVDSVLPRAGDSFKFNRYVYTNDNPTGMTDPDGKDPLNLAPIEGAITNFAINFALEVGRGIAQDVKRDVSSDLRNNTYTFSYGAGGIVATKVTATQSVAATSSLSASLSTHGQISVTGSIALLYGIGEGSSFGQQAGVSRSAGSSIPVGPSTSTTVHAEADFAVPDGPGFSGAVDADRNSFAVNGATVRISEGAIIFAGEGIQHSGTWTFNNPAGQQNLQNPKQGQSASTQ